MESCINMHGGYFPIHVPSSNRDPRTVAVRRECGRWIRDPQKVYDEMRAALRTKQVKIPDLFFCKDEGVFPGTVLCHVCYCTVLYVFFQVFLQSVLRLGFRMNARGAQQPRDLTPKHSGLSFDGIACHVSIPSLQRPLQGYADALRPCQPRA